MRVVLAVVLALLASLVSAQDTRKQHTAFPAASTSTTADSCSGTSEDVIATYTLPANSLATNGQGISFFAWGTCAANNNSKTVSLRFGGIGGTVLATNVATTTCNASSWGAYATILRTGAATQTSGGELELGSTTTSGVIVAAPTQTLSNAVDLVVTATCPTADADVAFIGYRATAIQP